MERKDFSPLQLFMHGEQRSMLGLPNALCKVFQLQVILLLSNFNENCTNVKEWRAHEG